MKDLGARGTGALQGLRPDPDQVLELEVVELRQDPVGGPWAVLVGWHRARRGRIPPSLQLRARGVFHGFGVEALIEAAGVSIDSAIRTGAAYDLHFPPEFGQPARQPARGVGGAATWEEHDRAQGAAHRR